MRKSRRVVVLVVSPIQELDLAGPLLVFSTATRLMGEGVRPYEISIVSTTRNRMIAGESGLSIVAHAYYQDIEGDIDSLLIVSGVKSRNHRNNELAAWLKRTVPTCRRVGTVCNAALPRARANVTTNQRATVHCTCERECGCRYPERLVDRMPSWLASGRICTSSCTSAGIDLALDWLDEDYGSAIAMETIDSWCCSCHVPLIKGCSMSSSADERAAIGQEL